MTTPNDGTPTYAPGWYPDTNAPGTERWYDGTAWTEHSRPLAPAAATVPAYAAAAPVAAAAEPVVKKPWFKRKAIIIPVGIVAGLIVISGIGNALGGNKGDDIDTAAAPAAEQSADPVVEEEVVEEEPEPVMVKVPGDLVGMTAAEAEDALSAVGLEADYDGDSDWEVLSAEPGKGEVEEGSTVALTLDEPPALTLAQENAVGAAIDYVTVLPFSKSKLIEQLHSEYGSGYELADAKFAVQYLEDNDLVDWKAEAVEAAEAYLDTMSFSRSSLYDQLTSEYGSGFTDKQAKHALKAVGY